MIRGIGMPDALEEEATLKAGRDFPSGSESEDSRGYVDPGDEFPSLAPQPGDPESDIPGSL